MQGQNQGQQYPQQGPPSASDGQDPTGWQQQPVLVLPLPPSHGGAAGVAGPEMWDSPAGGAQGGTQLHPASGAVNRGQPQMGVIAPLQQPFAPPAVVVQPWEPPQQQGIGEWPAPSAMPMRQDSWGMAPAQDSWIEMNVVPEVPVTGVPIAAGPTVGDTRSEDKWTGCEMCTLVFSWMLSLLVWYMLLVTIPVCEIQKTPRGICSWYWHESYSLRSYSTGRTLTRSAFPFIVFGFSYLFLAICMAYSPIRGYLSNILPGGVEQYLTSLTTATPTIRWHIVCSHSESSGSGKNRRTVTVVTHRAQYDYPYDSWWDVSEPMANTGNAIATRVRLDREWKAADAHTQKVHDAHHAAWVVANDRDVSKTVTIEVVVPDWKDSLLSFRNPDSPPFLLGPLWYLFFSFLSLGVLYQHYFYLRTTASDFTLAKLIRRVPRPDDPQQQE